MLLIDGDMANCINHIRQTGIYPFATIFFNIVHLRFDLLKGAKYHDCVR